MTSPRIFIKMAAALRKAGRVLPLSYYPAEVLRQTARTVRDVHDPRIQQLVSDMVTTVRFHDGLGLAAPQVGSLERIFVMRRPLSFYRGRQRRRRKHLEREFDVCINPEIRAHSEQQSLWPEGCLSIPEVQSFVRRKHGIVVRYLNEEGDRIRRRLVGLPAVVFQHELDHLNGVLILDREVPLEEDGEEMQRAIQRYEHDSMVHYSSMGEGESDSVAV